MHCAQVHPHDGSLEAMPKDDVMVPIGTGDGCFECCRHVAARLVVDEEELAREDTPKSKNMYLKGQPLKKV